LQKANLYKFFYAVGAFLAVAFLVRAAVDMFTYNPAANSAPVWAFVLADAATFLLPCLVVCIAGAVCKRRYNG